LRRIAMCLSFWDNDFWRIEASWEDFESSF
jgi:hypothetical protein